jgi:hypothetical protein
MARGISIRDVSNKIKNISDKDVLPISTGDNQPEVVEIGTVKNYIKEDIDIPEMEAMTNSEIERIFNKLNN